MGRIVFGLGLTLGILRGDAHGIWTFHIQISVEPADKVGALFAGFVPDLMAELCHRMGHPSGEYEDSSSEWKRVACRVKFRILHRRQKVLQPVKAIRIEFVPEH